MHAIDRKILEKIYRAIRNCDVLISGRRKLAAGCYKWWKHYLLFRNYDDWHFSKKKVFIYSQGIGTINRRLQSADGAMGFKSSRLYYSKR